MLKLSLFVSVVALALSSATTAHSSQCLDQSKVQDLIVKNSIGVEEAHFSNLPGAPSQFVFRLKGKKVLLIGFEGDCVTAETMTYKQYVASTIEPADECDGCGE